MSVRWLAWSLWGLCVLLTTLGLVFLVLNGGRLSDSNAFRGINAVFSVLFLTFPTVGAAIASREPGNAIGWLFLGAGLGAGLADFLFGYSEYVLVVEPGSLPGGEIAAVAGGAVELPTAAAASLLLLVIFPTGRPLSPIWRLWVWVVGIDLALFAVATLLDPGSLYEFPERTNPWGLDAAGWVSGWIWAVTLPVLYGSMLLGLVALTVRFRRAAGVERLQLKWLLYVAGLFVASAPVLIALETLGYDRVAGSFVGDLVFSLLVVLVPLAVGVAILRHRLYDIDVVINRTLVYAAVTLTLVAAYLGSVLLFRLVLTPLAGDSDLAVAGSTLAVAALFRPVRSRFQSVVDRRFYRSRYDAARTLEGFAGHLRDELDLETLGVDLRRVVRHTMQPAHVSLWLRQGEP